LFYVYVFGPSSFAAPVIGPYKQSVLLFEGDPLPLSVNATGAGALTYQWSKLSATVMAFTGRDSDLDGLGVAASFSNPSSVAVDLDGNVYVADTYNHKIRKITSAGVVSTLAGSGLAGAVE